MLCGMLILLACLQRNEVKPDDYGEIIEDTTVQDDTGETGLWIDEPPLAGAWEVEQLAIPIRGPEDGRNVGASIAIEDLDGDGTAELLIADDLHRVQSEGTVDGAVWILEIPTEETLITDDEPMVYGSRHESRAGSSMVALGEGRVAIGARYHNPDLVTIQGAIWILQGPVSAGENNLDHIAVRLDGLEGDELGTAMAAPGDVTGDGESDLLAGAPEVDGNGAVWLIPGPFTASGSIDDARAIGFRGEDGEGGAGTTVAAPGDINGDGIDDFVIGAPDQGEERNGAVYLVHGGDVTAGMFLADSDAILRGQFSLDRAGLALDGGDLDDDGYDEVVVGAPRYGNEDKGRAYVVNGPIEGEKNLGDAYARVAGVVEFGHLGAAVDVLGDLDGDGRAELVVGAPEHDQSGEDSGTVYVLYGPLIGEIDPIEEAQILGETARDTLGTVLHCPGDLNGDGLPDMLMSAPEAGDVWLYYGADSDE